MSYLYFLLFSPQFLNVLFENYLSEITAISKFNTKLLKIMLFTLSVNSLHRTLYVAKILFCYIVDGHSTLVCREIMMYIYVYNVGSFM